MDDGRREILNNLLKKLGFRERRFIEVRYGLGDVDAPHTIQETARIFRVTQGRARAILDKAKRAMVGHAYFEGAEVFEAVKDILGC